MPEPTPTDPRGPNASPKPIALTLPSDSPYSERAEVESEQMAMDMANRTLRPDLQELVDEIDQMVEESGLLKPKIQTNPSDT